MPSKFAWVTHAFDEGTGIAAFILGKSLRLASTKAQLVVIVDSNLPNLILQKLHLIYDLVIALNATKTYSPTILTIQCALGMTSFDKFILLHPSSIANIKQTNLDQLFKIEEKKIGNERLENLLLNKAPVLVKPCPEAHLHLQGIIEGKTKVGKFSTSFSGKSFNLIKTAFSYLNYGNDQKEEKVINWLAQLNSITFLSNNNGPNFATVLITQEFKTIENKNIIFYLPDLQNYLKNSAEIGQGTGMENNMVYKFWEHLYKKTFLEGMNLHPLDQFPEFFEGNLEKEPIAIIGMSCKLPSAKNVSEIWELLSNGKEAIRTAPAHRWTKTQHLFLPPGYENTKAGFLLDPIDEFDAKFFEISPKEAIAMDPQHRLLLEVVWEGLENGLINPQSVKGIRGGVFVGSWLNTYKEILELDTTVTEFFRSYTGNCIGPGAHRISQLLGWTGPCIGVESDCAAGLTAVSLACKSLQSGDCGIALACGVNLLLKPFTVGSMNHLLSPDYRCKTFDASADGFVRAEGVAVLVLKRYSDALKNSDNILGLIRGSAISQEGLSSSMGTPTVDSQVEAMSLALKDGIIDPSDVTYVEAHGTGTAVGDVVELSAISKVYKRDPSKAGYLTIGSAKPNVGHTESCSGITGIIKVILQMQNQLIPPHLNCKVLNPKINFKEMGARLPFSSIPWPRTPGKPRIAGISSFGLAGKNSHVILQEPPYPQHLEDKLNESTNLLRSLHILKISAKSESALNNLIKMYQGLFESCEQSSFADIAHTANTSRADFKFRAAILAENNKVAFELFKKKSFKMSEAVLNPQKEICFLFTGQGSQYEGMAQALYTTSPIFKLYFDYCNDWLQSNYQISIKQTYFTKTLQGEVDRTIFSQTGIFVVEFCLMKLWQSWGIKPSYVLGHSLGEYCAAVCAGILSIEDALTLVAERSLLIDQLKSGKMLAIKADKKTVAHFQSLFFFDENEILDFAAFNSKDQTVVAGCPEKIKNFKEFLEVRNVKSTVLKSTHGFHSKDMDLILEPFGKIAEKINYKEPSPGITFISGMLGKVFDKIDKHYWVRHTRDPVDFLGACKVLLNLNCSLYLEIGPNPVLSALLMLNKFDNKAEKETLCLPSLRKGTDDWRTMLSSLEKLYLEGVEINWEGLDKHLNLKKIPHYLPSYPFEGGKYWPKISTSLETSSEHPFLGSIFPNPTNTIIFHNKLGVAEGLNYLKDHMLGDRIIFPGAGYIEIMLAAGSSYAFGGDGVKFTTPCRPIQLTNFKINLPLEIHEEVGDEVNCQIVLKHTETGDEIESSVHHLEKNTWVKNASGVFLPYNLLQSETVLSELDTLLDSQFNNAASNLSLISNLKTTLKEESLLNSFYKRFAPVGLHLGPDFQTLKKVWKSSESTKLLVEVEVPKDFQKYLLHPVLIDCMIQSSAFPIRDDAATADLGFSKPKLIVPVGCNKFTWYRPLETSKCFIYSPNKDQRSAVLFDKVGNLVAILYGLEVAETTLENIKAILEPRGKFLPNFYNFDWKPSSSQLRIAKIKDGVDIAKEKPKIVAVLSKGEKELKEDINKLVSLYILKALITLGLEPGKIFCENELKNTLGIAQEHEKLFKHFLGFLEKDGLVKKSSNKLIFDLPSFYSVDVITLEINQLVNKHCANTSENEAIPMEHVPILLLHKVGMKLERYISGVESALSVLYPKDSTEVTAGRYYERMYSRLSSVLPSILKEQWLGLNKFYKEKGQLVPTLRVLEIGAGTGLVSGQFLESLEEAQIPFEYLYTDISSAFFSDAEQRFKKHGGRIKFKKLNIEEDPLSQGFPPQYFDVVVAFHVVHALKDIQQSLGYIRNVMVDGGNLWLSETIGEDRMTDCLFGLLDGFWRFTDLNLRPAHCMLSATKWEMITKQVGFSDFNYISDDDQYTYGLLSCRARSQKSLQLYSTPQHYPVWLVVYKPGEESFVTEITKCVEKTARKISLVKISQEVDNSEEFASYNLHCVNLSEVKCLRSEFQNLLTKVATQEQLEGVILTWGLSNNENQEIIAKPYLSLLQAFINLGEANLNPLCVLLTQGQYPVGDISCPNPFSSTLIGMTITAMNEHKNLNLRIIDLDPTVDLSLSFWQSIQRTFTLFEKEPNLVTVMRGEEIFTPKFTEERHFPQYLSLPSTSDRFQIEMPTTKMVQDVQFQPLQTYSLAPDEIEVKISFTALNFRDVLSILKPEKFFEKYNRVGVDFSGVISHVGHSVRKWKVGDEVFGLNLSQQHLPSHVQINENLVQKIPPSFTLAETSTIPLAFATAFHSIVEIAKAQPNQRILIHAASGGVGLLAVQIAKYLNLEIFCTAGNERKRAYLKSLGISHVFNSRTLDFSKEILKVTNGEGVDIVLNSLTGHGFKEATLKLCSKRAYFIELSKINIWTPGDVNALRKDVSYSVVDPISFEKTLLTGKYTLTAYEWMATGKIQPIPQIRFDVERFKDAVTYLQEARQIGRVLCQMPRSNLPQLKSMHTPLFNEKSTYLITGGLGGIGLEVCKYMVHQGARHIVLLGRSLPTESTKELLESFQTLNNCNIVVCQGNVGNLKDLEEIFEMVLNKLPPLRGVMHAAGTLSDGMLESLEWNDFEKTFESKVEGSWNLHKLTKNLHLEHFVMYSSVASKFALSGQASHVSGCFFQDTLAHYRNSNGLPATTINWGQWTEVGVAKNMDIKYVLPFNLDQGINALDKILRENLSSSTVVNLRISLGSFVNHYPYMKQVIDKEILKSKNELKGDKIKSVDFWNDYDNCSTLEEKENVGKQYVETMLRNMLRLDEEEKINETLDLSVMGMDSLMMIELFNKMQSTCGKRVAMSQSAIRECKTLKALAIRFVEIIEETWKETPAPSVEEVEKLSVLDAVLPQDIQQERPGSQVAPSEIKCLLMTGTTGFVGSHMLQEFLEECPQLEKIYCLVRGEEPLKRLLSVFQRNRIPLSKNFEKVVVLSGDFTRVNLGLPEEKYLKLCEEVEAVHHIGAMMHHYEYYRKVEGSSKDIRSVNVGGLLKLLEFVCKIKTKHLFHTSSLVLAWERGEDGELLECWPSLERLASLGTNMGYPVSKMVNELHLKQAVEERGIPCKVLRYCQLRASTTSGKSFAEGSHLMKVAIFGMKEGIASSEPYPVNLIAVDVAAKITREIIFKDDAPTGVYNVSHPQPMLLKECYEKAGAELGYEIKPVSSEEFAARVVQKCSQAKKEFERGGESSILKKAIVYELQMVYQDKNLYGFLLQFANATGEGRKGCEGFWVSKKLERFVPQIYSQLESPLDCLKRDLKAAANEGLFDLF